MGVVDWNMVVEHDSRRKPFLLRDALPIAQECTLMPVSTCARYLLGERHRVMAGLGSARDRDPGDRRRVASRQSPTLPSINSRRMSAWPACRAVSRITCRYIHVSSLPCGVVTA